jgi:hypothetical protein
MQSTKELATMREWLLHTKPSLETRLQNMEIMKRVLLGRVDGLFNTLMSQQGHSGRVLANHNERTLQVRCTPNASSRARA